MNIAQNTKQQAVDRVREELAVLIEHTSRIYTMRIGHADRASRFRLFCVTPDGERIEELTSRAHLVLGFEMRYGAVVVTGDGDRASDLVRQLSIAIFGVPGELVSVAL